VYRDRFRGEATSSVSFLRLFGGEMSTPSDSPDLKGGRPPAVKVGGMRVVQHKRVTGESEKTEEEKPAEEVAENEKNENEEVVEKDPSTEEVAASSYHKSDRDFPKEAIHSYHVKPLPGKDLNAHAHQKPQHHHIQQPRKDWMRRFSLVFTSVVGPNEGVGVGW